MRESRGLAHRGFHFECPPREGEDPADTDLLAFRAADPAVRRPCGAYVHRAIGRSAPGRPGCGRFVRTDDVSTIDGFATGHARNLGPAASRVRCARACGDDAAAESAPAS